MEERLPTLVIAVLSGGLFTKNQESAGAWVTKSPRSTHKVTPRALTGTPILLWKDQHNGGLHAEQDILYFVDDFRAGHGMGKQGWCRRWADTKSILIIL